MFREAFRALKPRGRLAISDIVATAPIPEAVASDVAALCGCVVGAASATELPDILRACGFESIQVGVAEESRAMIREWLPGAEKYVASATIEAVKPVSAER